MRICFIGDGDSIHNHFMVEWFLKQGHEILFLTDTPETFPYPDVQRWIVPRHGGGIFRHLRAARQVRWWIRQWKPDLVHAHNVTGYGYWGAFSGFSPLVITAWGSDLNIISKQNSVFRSIISFCLRRADLITGDAEDLCQTARSLTGNRIDVRCLQWGIDFETFANEPDAIVRDRIRNGKDFVFLSTRRLRPIYNIDTIIQAYAKAYPHMPSSRLLIVGDDQLKPELESLVQSLNLTDHIHFTGWLPQDVLIQTLHSADVFLSIPTSDSTALSLLEAFAARLPVIVADLPANREWIVPGKNGILVTPGDIDSLADAMIELTHNPFRNLEWGRLNRQIVEERGNRETEMRKLVTWYRELISPKQRLS